MFQSAAATVAMRYTAFDRSSAIIRFTPDGTILHANENFLAAVGYTLEEVQGKHHRMFVDPAYAKSQEYVDFWKRLGNGAFEVAEYKRFGKGGREIWLHAS